MKLDKATACAYIARDEGTAPLSRVSSVREDTLEKCVGSAPLA